MYNFIQVCIVIQTLLLLIIPLLCIVYNKMMVISYIWWPLGPLHPYIPKHMPKTLYILIAMRSRESDPSDPFEDMCISQALKESKSVILCNDMETVQCWVKC